MLLRSLKKIFPHKNGIIIAILKKYFKPKILLFSYFSTGLKIQTFPIKNIIGFSDSKLFTMGPFEQMSLFCIEDVILE